MDYKKTTAVAILRSYGTAKYHYEKLVEEANKIDLTNPDNHDLWRLTFFQAGCFLRQAIDYTAALQHKGGPFVGFLQEDNEDIKEIQAAMTYFDKHYDDWYKVIEKMEKESTHEEQNVIQ